MIFSGLAYVRKTKTRFIQGSLELSDTTDLSELIDRLGITHRNWEVLESRCGFSKPLFLSQIAAQHNFTRARAAQIEANSSKKIVARAAVVACALVSLEGSAATLSLALKQRKYASFLSSCQHALIEANWSEVNSQSVRRLMIAFREAAIADERGIILAFPKLKTVVHQLALGLSVRSKYSLSTQRFSAKVLAELVLADAKKPLHYRQIQAESENRQPYKPPSLKAIIAALQKHPDIYARIAPGIYGLTTWGLKTAEPYQSIVIATLEASGRPLTEGEIFQSVNIKRSIKKNTLWMCLNREHAFYKSLEGTYGLREWLLPREKQTIRSPKWQVEDRTSLRRLNDGDAKDE